LRSSTVSNPSLLRSINVCKRRSARRGRGNFPTEATQDFGAEMIAAMTEKCSMTLRLSISQASQCVQTGRPA
jgi:adenylosuccinate synthase